MTDRTPPPRPNQTVHNPPRRRSPAELDDQLRAAMEADPVTASLVATIREAIGDLQTACDEAAAGVDALIADMGTQPARIHAAMRQVRYSYEAQRRELKRALYYVTPPEPGADTVRPF